MAVLLTTYINRAHLITDACISFINQTVSLVDVLSVDEIATLSVIQYSSTRPSKRP